jgi:hypothetical protein
MNARMQQTLLEKLNALPPQKLAEVEAFVDFLHSREEQRGLTRAAAAAATPAFAKVWENDDDAVYDQL